MTTTFKRAPLIEMVAELRWGEAPAQPTPGVPMLLNSHVDDETPFVRLGGELYQHGFRRVERVIPPGFPMLPYQPVYRYRSEADVGSSITYQAGPGIFVINAIPPYRSWENVERFVLQGVEALLQSRELPNVEPFSSVSLRYINGFGAELTGARDVGSFVSEVFGFGLTIPDSLRRHQQPGKPIEPQLRLSVPLEDGAALAVVIAQGVINSESKLILDLSVSSGGPTAANASEVMASFRKARNVIHDIFVDWTKPIHHLLQPVEDDQHAS